MTDSQLSLIRREQEPLAVPSHLSAIPIRTLRRQACDKELHMVFRGQLIWELARRQDPLSIDLCARLLRSGGIDDWLTAVRCLETLGTDLSIDLLMTEHGRRKGIHRRMVFQAIARSLPQSRLKEFSQLLKGHVRSGELDITGWSVTALSVMTLTAKRLGIRLSPTGRLPTAVSRPFREQVDDRKLALTIKSMNT